MEVNSSHFSFLNIFLFLNFDQDKEVLDTLNHGLCNMFMHI